MSTRPLISLFCTPGCDGDRRLDIEPFWHHEAEDNFGYTSLAKFEVDGKDLVQYISSPRAKVVVLCHGEVTAMAVLKECLDPVHDLSWKTISQESISYAFHSVQLSYDLARSAANQNCTVPCPAFPDIQMLLFALYENNLFIANQQGYEVLGIPNLPIAENNGNELQFLRFDIGPHQQRRTFLFGSRGLWVGLSTQEALSLASRLLHEKPEKRVAESLIAKAMENIAERKTHGGYIYAGKTGASNYDVTAGVLRI